MAASTSGAQFLKRLLDIFIGLLTLIPFIFLFPIFALWIKWDSKGPIFYVHKRIGREGQPFTCYKFRTMYTGVDAQTLAGSDEDSRITPSGKFLRSTSLDELPQLFNILNGTMSVVGPRPTLDNMAREYTSHQAQRLNMKPGMTGWAQVNGRNSLPYELRLEMDVWYIQNWSFKLDLQILWKTIGVVSRREGLYQIDDEERAKQVRAWLEKERDANRYH